MHVAHQKMVECLESHRHQQYVFPRHHQALSAEENKARRDRLAKMRALLFYHERKAAKMKVCCRPTHCSCRGSCLQPLLF